MQVVLLGSDPINAEQTVKVIARQLLDWRDECFGRSLYLLPLRYGIAFCASTCLTNFARLSAGSVNFSPSLPLDVSLSLSVDVERRQFRCRKRLPLCSCERESTECHRNIFGMCTSRRELHRRARRYMHRNHRRILGGSRRTTTYRRRQHFDAFHVGLKSGFFEAILPAYF